MDLLAKDNTSVALVAREEAKRHDYPTATAPAASVEVLWRYDDEAADAARTVADFATGAQGSIPYNPVQDKNVVLMTRSRSAWGTRDVSSLADALAATVPFSRETVTVGGIDEHVPTVTLPPSVAKENESQWIVFTPAPDDDAATTKYGRIRVRKADELSVEYLYNCPVAGFHHIPQPAFDCVVDYSWLGQSSEDIGEGRGWSEWSPTSTAAGSAAGTQPPPVAEVLPTVIFDANDSMAAIERGVVVE